MKRVSCDNLEEICGWLFVICGYLWRTKTICGLFVYLWTCGLFVICGQWTCGSLGAWALGSQRLYLWWTCGLVAYLWTCCCNVVGSLVLLLFGTCQCHPGV